MPDFVNTLASLGVKINVLNKKDFTSLIKSCINSEDKVKLIQGIIPDIAQDGSLEYNDTVVIKSDYSQKILKNVDFIWPKLEQDYLLKYLQYLQKINFIDLRR